MQEMIPYRVFSDAESADAYLQFFTDQGIAFKLEKVSLNLVPYLFFSREVNYVLMINESDLLTADDVLAKNTELEDGTNPLAELDTEELMDILKNQDEWGTDEVVIARNMLLSKSIKVSDAQMMEYRNQRLEILSKPEQGNIYTILIGYLFTPMGIIFSYGLGIFAIMMLLISYAIGINYIFDYKRLPIGEKIKTFNAPTRKLGLFMVILASVFTIVGIAIRIQWFQEFIGN